MLIHTLRRQQGVTLIELMIGITVGLIILLGVLTVYLSTIQSSAATLKSIRINQEIRAVLEIMTSDIARAGYWENTDTQVASIATVTNPFTTANSDLQVTGSSDCIMFTYDYDRSGTLDMTVDDIHGYRLSGGALQMIQGIPAGTTAVDTSNCGSVTWQSLTDSKVITVRSLRFTVNTRCTNITADPDTDCTTVTPATGDITVTTRDVQISITAMLTDDLTVRRTLTDSVKVRNDSIKVTP